MKRNAIYQQGAVALAWYVTFLFLLLRSSEGPLRSNATIPANWMQQSLQGKMPQYFSLLLSHNAPNQPLETFPKEEKKNFSISLNLLHFTSPHHLYLKAQTWLFLPSSLGMIRGIGKENPEKALLFGSGTGRQVPFTQRCRDH